MLYLSGLYIDEIEFFKMRIVFFFAKYLCFFITTEFCFKRNIFTVSLILFLNKILKVKHNKIHKECFLLHQ